MKSTLQWVLAALLAVPGIADALPKIEYFAQHPAFQDVTISPKGDYLATKVHLKNGFGLAVIRLADNKITATIAMRNGEELDRYVWVGPTRLIVQPAGYFGTLAEPVSIGELSALNVDDSDERFLIGGPGEGAEVTYDNAAVTVLSSIQGDPQHAVVQVTYLGNSSVSAGGLVSGDEDSSSGSACRIDVEKGLLTDCISAPQKGPVEFVADHSGKIRYAIGYKQMWYLDPNDHHWHSVSDDGLGDATPIGFSRDNNRLYLKMNANGDRGCLVELTVATREQRALSCDPTADLGSAIFSFDGSEPIAAFYNYDHPKIEYLDTKNHDKDLLQQLEANFPGAVVLPVSSSNDGGRVILYVYSDRDPGAYYLFDSKAMKVSPLAAAMQGIVPEEMGERRPLTYKARDGQPIHGFLTIPPGRELKNLPLVVLPHGGPFGEADDWGWDSDAQLLATRGYAVLQVNFRGSGGYGDNFEAAGRKGWKTVMIDDITDGTHWAIQQGYVDPKRVCIFGASYGGYAALMSAEREPDLYRCAIGYAGVYDLNLMMHGTWFKNASDSSQSTIGRDFFSENVGSTPDELKAASPVNMVDRLKAAIMIIHGTEDTRAPLDQAKALRDALDAHHYPYEWFVKSGEGHGFYDPADCAELYTRLLAFLEKNIGPGAPSAATPSPDANPSTAAAVEARPQAPDAKKP